MISDLIISLVIVVGISALGIFLSGLPGIFLLWLAQPYIRCLFGVNPLKKINTEAGFALILLISGFWSLSLYPAYMVAFRIYSDYAKLSQIAIFIAVLYVVSVALSTILYGLIYLFYDSS